VPDLPLLTPTADQLAWQQRRVGLFFHVGINTYFGKEWSDGTLPASAFDPTGLDVDGWMEVAVAAGARYVILTAKHHDGFCLWPTETTRYGVASAPWQGGRGDLVGEFVAAARRHRLAVGLYLSPWDRNADCYADPVAYSRLYRQQLTELCTRYGELAELWFDGAGSEGYTYDWPAIMDVVHTHQPQAMVFNMGSPTIRWVGNEDGLAAEPVDYVVRRTQFSNYTVVASDLTEALYLPPECDVSVRRGWFWAEQDEPKTVEHLLAIFYRSVGLGANLLLNVPPDRDGRIDLADAAVVRAFGAEVDRRFGAPVVARLDHDGPHRVIAELPADTAFDHVWLEEELVAGQRIRRHRVLIGGEVIAEGSTVGATRIHLVGPQRSRRLEIELTGADPRLLTVRVHRTGVAHVEQVPEGYVAPTDAPDS
jgi:alpha-L-fucosidase